LAGLSAGSLCWFEERVTDSINVNGPLSGLKCLGFLKGGHCSHYDGEINRRPAYHKLILEGNLNEGLAADDGVAIQFIDEEIFKVVSSRPEAKAFAVKKINGSIIEEPIITQFLGYTCLVSIFRT
jgi:dipeptidase E